MTAAKEIHWVDARSVIGLYPISNVGTILVHKIDYGENRVLVSINCEEPEWCRLEEKPTDDGEELGFMLGSFFRSLP